MMVSVRALQSSSVLWVRFRSPASSYQVHYRLIELQSCRHRYPSRPRQQLHPRVVPRERQSRVLCFSPQIHIRSVDLPVQTQPAMCSGSVLDGKAEVSPDETPPNELARLGVGSENETVKLLACTCEAEERLEVEEREEIVDEDVYR